MKSQDWQAGEQGFVPRSEPPVTMRGSSSGRGISQGAQAALWSQEIRLAGAVGVLRGWALSKWAGRVRWITAQASPVSPLAE